MFGSFYLIWILNLSLEFRKGHPSVVLILINGLQEGISWPSLSLSKTDQPWLTQTPSKGKYCILIQINWDRKDNPGLFILWQPELRVPNVKE